jgi:hypothetical protein
MSPELFHRLTIATSHDMDNAAKYARQAKVTSPGELAYDALIQMAIICYCRPFGPNQRGRSDGPAADRVPGLPLGLTAEQVELHQTLMDFHNRAIAHSEFQLNPTSYDEKNFVISLRPFSIHQVPDFQTLPDRLVALCEAITDKWHAIRFSYLSDRGNLPSS